MRKYYKWETSLVLFLRQIRSSFVNLHENQLFNTVSILFVSVFNTQYLNNDYCKWRNNCKILKDNRFQEVFKVKCIFTYLDFSLCLNFLRYFFFFFTFYWINMTSKTYWFKKTGDSPFWSLRKLRNRGLPRGFCGYVCYLESTFKDKKI